MNGADRFGVNTYAYTQQTTAEDCLKRLNDQGFHHFELMMYPGFLWPDDMDGAGYAHFRRFLAGHRLRVVSINMPNVDINITAAGAEMRAYSLDLLERFVRLGGEIGAQGIVIGIGKANPLFPAPAAQLEGHLFRALDRLGRAAEQAGTAVWAENMPFAWETTTAGLMRVLDRYGDDRIGVVYDAANSWFAGEDLAAAVRTVAPRLRLVHLSDTGQTVYRHDRIGSGTVPFQVLPDVLDEVGYRDWPMLEIIDRDPDTALRDSVAALLRAGFGRLPAGADA